MSIRATDLDKYNDLVALLDAWRTAAENIGIELQGVTVVPQGAYQSAQIAYEDDGYNAAYWSING
jgi:hypothetical protein